MLGTMLHEVASARHDERVREAGSRLRRESGTWATARRSRQALARRPWRRLPFPLGAVAAVPQRG